MYENCIINISLRCFSSRYKDSCIFEKKKNNNSVPFGEEKCFFSQFLNYEGNVFQLLFPSIKHRLDTAQQQRNDAERHGEDEQIKIIIIIRL